ncbi:MAG TPA: alkaline phosphatase family protein, partial [Lentzea sp.]
PQTGPNLLVNGDGEVADASTSGYDGVTVPGWRATGVPTIVGYSVGKGFPTSGQGAQFFAGGPIGDSALSQTVSVSQAGSQIDAGGVTYTLSGLLGGYSSEISSTTVKITFRNASGTALGTGQIGPVTAADRGNATKLLQRTANASVPAGTRTIDVLATFSGDPLRNAANQYNDAYADNLALTLSATLPNAPAPTPPPSSVPGFDHVFFTILENRTRDQVIGNGDAPYLSALAQNNSSLGDSYGVVHPSDPNYMAVAGGSTFGHTDNPWPAGMGSIDAPNIADRIEGVGKTWRGYIEDMGTPCNRTSSGNFDVDNLPFLFFKNIANDDARCRRSLHPVSQLWTDLQSTATTPNFVWFEPNTCNTMHNCSTRTGDDWFRANLPKILNSPAFTQQRSLLIITFDEDDNYHGQRIPTIVVGSQGTVKTGYVSTNRHDHYSVSRTMENALGLAPLTRNDTFATPINDVWK